MLASGLDPADCDAEACWLGVLALQFWGLLMQFPQIHPHEFEAAVLQVTYLTAVLKIIVCIMTSASEIRLRRS